MALQQTAEFERLLQAAHDRGASDLFLLPDEPPTFRVAGYIERGEGDPLTAQQLAEMAASLFGETEIRTVGSERGRLITSCSLPGIMDSRVCLAKSLGAYTLHVRTLAAGVHDAKSIGVPEAMLRAAESPNGLVVCAGLAGSGKTTVLYSLVDHLNTTQACHICTIEDPTGARFLPKRAIVQQREVGIDSPDTLSGISAAMVQDLDVLMVGEIKTLEELAAVVTTAQTGHLVLTQVHAPSPEDAIRRLIDVQADEDGSAFRKALARSLRAVSAQCLVPKASGKGRVPAYGVLVIDEEMRKAIVEGRDPLDRSTPLPAGCQSLEADLERLAREGTITEDAKAKALRELA
ncbi:MAG: type IV pilus twitching motility protein PilT [Planctomycetota bacterium]|jgi:twitching motility protein PilT